MKIMLINPALKLSKKQGFIDYPYFANLGTYQIRSILSGDEQESDQKTASDRKANEQEDKDAKNKLVVSDAFYEGAKEDGDMICLGSDRKHLGIFRSFKPDAVIFQNSPYLSVRSLSPLAGEMRKAGAKVFLADNFITGMHYHDYDAEPLLDIFDSVCRHESEKGIQLALSGKRGIIMPGFIEDLDSLPMTKFSREESDLLDRFYRDCQSLGITDLLDFSQKAIPLVTSRSCRYNCTFCSSRIFGRGFRMHSISYLDSYLAYLAGEHRIKSLIILDDLLNPDKERLKSLLSLFRKHGLTIQLPNGIRAEHIDPEAMRMLKSISSWVKTSAETGSGRVMQEIRKGLDISDVERFCSLSFENRIRTYVHFIIGFPKETIEEVNATFRLAASLRHNYGAEPIVQLAAPIKGTALHEQWPGPKSDYNSYFHGKYHRTLPEMTERFSREQEKLIINLTYKCNNNCIMCAVGDREKVDGDLAEQKRLISQAKKQGITSLDIDGGEPTSSPALFELISFAKDSGFKDINLTTNGRRLSDRGFTADILDSGITSLLISLHGSGSGIHEKITGTRGSFLETVEGIDNALSCWKDKRERIGINFTLLKQNQDDLARFARFIQALGVRKLNIQLVTPFGRAKKEHMPDIKAAAETILSIKKKDMFSILNLINFQPCLLTEELHHNCIQDFGKSSREMAFINQDKENLADYLASKRVKKDSCISCIYDNCCGGFWSYD